LPVEVEPQAERISMPVGRNREIAEPAMVEDSKHVPSRHIAAKNAVAPIPEQTKASQFMQPRLWPPKHKVPQMRS